MRENRKRNTNGVERKYIMCEGEKRDTKRDVIKGKGERKRRVG